MTIIPKGYIRIPDYPDYFISKDGYVYSSKSKKILKPDNYGRGYIYYHLKKDGKTITHGRYRLLCMAYKPIPNYKNLTVDHINGIPGDDRLENLEWVSIKENIKRYYKNNLSLRRKPIIVKFAKTGEVKEYDNHILCAKDLKLHRYEILRRVNSGHMFMHKDFTLYKWKDNRNDFPIIEDIYDYRKRCQREKAVKIYNHLTKEEKEFPNSQRACDYLNISPGTLSSLIRTKNKLRKITRLGWEAKYYYDNTPWTYLTQDEIIALEFGSRFARPIYVLDLQNNQKHIFATGRQAAEFLNISPQYITEYCKRLTKPYKNRFKISYYVKK